MPMFHPILLAQSLFPNTNSTINIRDKMSIPINVISTEYSVNRETLCTPITDFDVAIRKRGITDDGSKRAIRTWVKISSWYVPSEPEYHEHKRAGIMAINLIVEWWNQPGMSILKKFWRIGWPLNFQVSAVVWFESNRISIKAKGPNRLLNTCKKSVSLHQNMITKWVSFVMFL